MPTTITAEKIILLVPSMKELEIISILEAIDDEVEKRNSEHIFDFVKIAEQTEIAKLKNTIELLEKSKESIQMNLETERSKLIQIQKIATNGKEKT